MGWPEKREVLSTLVRREDAPMKVTGKAKYSSDVQPDGLLYGMILRSPWPAAKIHSINLEKAQKAPGIKAAILVKEKAGSAERTIRYYGEELAAVAGVTKQACLDALKLIEVNHTPHKFVVKEEDAKREDSPRVFEEHPNLAPSKVSQKGNVEKAFAESAAIVEGFFTTQVQIHHPLETHGNTISATETEMTAWASTQAVMGVRESLAKNMQLPENKVHVITEFMGGGFGAKFGPGVEGATAARLSKAAGAPVKLMLTRFDQSLAVGNRPSSFQKIKLGADKEGKLTAFDIEYFGTGGIGGGGVSEGGDGDVKLPVPYIYEIPNTRVNQSSVAINAGSSRAFRAPKHPLASFGMESILDEMAVKLGIDPVEIRIKNDPSEVRRREYQIGAEKFNWKSKYRKPGTSEGVVKTGVGCAGAMWKGAGKGTQAEVQITSDGSVEVRCATQDIGTGTRTLLSIIAAEIFGLKPEQITPKVGDSNYPPSGGSGGSTTAASVSPAIFDACQNALKELQTRSGLTDVRGSKWKEACAKLGLNPLVVQGKWQEGLSSGGVGGVQFAEVEVDTETGFIKLKKILCVQDCGLIVNRLTCESQVNGGVIMGIGYAMYEERVMDRQSGMMLNPNFETYKLPNFADIPEIEIVLLDMPERGVIGVGEPVTVPTASAIANAVSNAIGARITSLPVTPAKVLAALGKVPVAVSPV
jgi:xanthine dehydrogenase YagR molybdenum-binding subunit